MSGRKYLLLALVLLTSIGSTALDVSSVSASPFSDRSSSRPASSVSVATGKTSPAHPASVAQPSYSISSEVAALASQSSYSTDIPQLRTRNSRTYIRPHGGLRTEVTQVSQNYQDSSGAWQPIDNTLLKSAAPGYSYQNSANAYTVYLPSNLATTPIKFVSGNNWATIQLSGASGSPNLAGNSATYSDAFGGVSIRYTALNDGVNEDLVIAGPVALPSFSYVLKLSDGLSASLDQSGGIAVRNASASVFDFPPGYMYDSANDGAPVPVPATLAATSGGYSVVVQPDATWLASPGRRWPVTIDPTMNFTLNTDCYIVSGSSANTNFCTGSTLNVGYDGTAISRSLLQFGLPISPTATILNASLELELSHAQSSSAQSVELHQVTHGWTSSVTWNTKDGSNNWTTAGGDFNSTAQSTASAGPTVGSIYYWPLTSLVQGWVNQSISNKGLILKAANEGTAGQLQFYSDRASCVPSCQAPTLSVEYFYGLGEEPWYQEDSYPLTDRTHIATNPADGNLILSANDLSVHGTGLALNITRTYNSLAYVQGQVGWNWQLNVGKDVFLETGTGTGSWDGPVYHQPDGNVFKFTQSGSTFTPPAGVNATLVQNDSSHWTLTFNQSGEKYKFTNLGDPNCAGCAYQTSDVDRNGDTITMSYDSHYRLSTITDTQGRQVTFAYNYSGSSSLISSMTDSSSRQYQYSYQSGTPNLNGYTDPNSKSTSYGYNSFPLLNQITDARGNVINLGFDSNPNITSVGFVNTSCSGGSCSYSYTYNGGTSSVCTASGVTRNRVRTDPNGNSIRNCYDNLMQTLQTFNGVGNNQQVTFTANNDPQQLTDASSNSSQLTHNSNNDLTQTTLPVLGSGQTAPSFSAVFNTPSTVARYQFLPSSVTDPQGNCTAYVYDSAGNITDTYAGQASSCDGKTGGTHTGSRYQGDPGISCGGKTGQLCSTINGNGNSTTYGYDSNGNMTSLTPPSPAGSTTITVDGLSRVSTVTDGKGQKTTYSYDGLDRVTQILFNGAINCVPSNGSCITYSYDGDGNRTSLVDQTGTTSYYYDTMNRMTTESLPSTNSACSGSSPSGLTQTYDGVGNLLTSCDAGGTTTYAYNSANQLTSIAEPGGNCGSTPSLCTTFAYNADGNRTTVTFPGGATQTTGYDNDQNVTSVVGKSSTGTTLTNFAYTYVNGANDTPLVQTTSENDAVAANTYTYSYDGLNRLSGASVTSGTGTSYTYSYDSDGNMLRRVAGSATTSYGYNTADQLCWAYTGTSSNACSSPPSGATTYTFDGNGNETGSSAGASFSYNPKDQTTSITYGGTTLGSLAYTDGGQQQRISAGSSSFTNEMGNVGISTSGSSSTYYLLDPNGNVLGERIGSTHYYFLTDHLGSVVAVISGDGQTVSDRYGYDPYGNTTYSSGSVSNPWGYVGGYTDSTGLIHFGARYYDPSMARWTQIDPAHQGPSLYEYAGDDPVNFSDPSGAFCCYHRTTTVVATTYWGRYHWDWVHVWLYASPTDVAHAQGALTWLAGILTVVLLALGQPELLAAIGLVIAYALGWISWASGSGRGEWWNAGFLISGWSWSPTWSYYTWSASSVFWAEPY